MTYTADPVNGFNAVVDKGPLPVRDLQKLGPISHQPQPAYHQAQPAYHQAQPAYHQAQPAYHQAQPAYHPVAAYNAAPAAPIYQDY